MEKNRTIVYGLGKTFHDNKDEILSCYNVVGLCDKDEDKVIKSGGVTRDYLKKNQNEYDKVLVCANPHIIVSDLTGNLHIPNEKITIYDKCRESIAYQDIMNFWGERNEDAAILLVASMLGLKFSKLRYLEIGTNNPVLANNSYALYRNGARGVLVDAVPFFVPLIDFFRPNDIFIQAAITDTDSNEKATFYLPTWSDGSCELPIGSLNEKWRENFRDKGITDCVTMEVTTLNINALLKKIGFLPDILLIDIEGFDKRVLKAIDYSCYKPKIIVAELGVISNDMRLFMREKGYEVFTNIGYCNAIFVSKEAWDSRGQ